MKILTRIHTEELYASQKDCKIQEEPPETAPFRMCLWSTYTYSQRKKKSKPKKALLHGGACEADVPLPENLLTEPITQKHRSQISAQWKTCTFVDSFFFLPPKKLNENMGRGNEIITFVVSVSGIVWLTRRSCGHTVYEIDMTSGSSTQLTWLTLINGWPLSSFSWATLPKRRDLAP